ncbi:MAG: GntR family transcriptional regulator [Anaerolineales bacterium]|nr:GntR family transcriptional regulator [Anaerolineales bacterium]
MSPHNPLDHRSYVPLYYQLRDKLRLLIDENLAAGDQIPSENELVQRYRVSRNTVRLAIESLIKEGVVYRIQGKGTFVSPQHMRYDLQRLVSFTEDMRRRGLKPDTRLLGFTRKPPPFHVANRLGLPPESESYEIRRLRLADGEPMAVSTAYMPCDLVPELTEGDLVSGSVFKTIEGRLRLKIGYADRILKAASADDDQAELLKVEPGFPLMLVEGATYLDNETPIEYVVIYYRADRYDFAYRAVRPPK